jgi:hypothetical protein
MVELQLIMAAASVKWTVTNPGWLSHTSEQSRHKVAHDASPIIIKVQGVLQKKNSICSDILYNTFCQQQQ